MTQFVIGACCAHGAARFPGKAFAVPADANGKPVHEFALQPNIPVRVLDYEPAVGLPVCVHEASHAVMATLIGLHVRQIVVGPVCEVRTDWSVSPPISVGSTVVMLLAGWIGQNKIARFFYRMTDAEILEFVHAARDGTGGGCDECRVGKIASVIDDADAVAFWRELERQALDIINRPDVWRAIRQIADRLIVDRSVSGDEVRRLVRANIDLEQFKLPTWEEGNENV